MLKILIVYLIVVIENMQGNGKTTIHKNCLKIKISNYVRLVKSIPNYKTFIYKFKISILTLISFIKEVYFIKLTNKNYHLLFNQNIYKQAITHL